jgi:ketosteroid isomerase-like protein
MRDDGVRPRSRCRIASAVLLSAFAMTAADIRAHAPDADERALASLVDAELSFARMGGERGIRDAFLANFDDDGIVFEPDPVALRATWGARPAPDDPLEPRLQWKPAQAGIARSHDIGYTTGPFTLTVAGPPRQVRHGVFFSVWKRDRAGRWRVMVDAGISTPAAVDFAPLGAAPRPRYSGRADAKQQQRRILDIEAATSGNDDAGLTPNDYAQRIAADIRLHHDGAPPVTPRSVVAADIARTAARLSWTPLDARVSAAADFAYTYGRLRRVDHDGRAHAGYYVHVWLREASGAWRLAYDIAVPAGP